MTQATAALAIYTITYRKILFGTVLAVAIALSSNKSLADNRSTNAIAAPSISLSATPQLISYGGSAQLNWSSTNATSCLAGGTWWGGIRPTSGTANTGRLTAQQSVFTLTCSGPGGSKTTSTTVTIGQATNQPPTPTPTPTPTPPPGKARPTISFYASPSVIRFGESTTLTWSSINASSCIAGGTWWGGIRHTSGSANTGRLTEQNSQFLLTCSGPGGSTTVSTTVTFGGSTTPPPAPAPPPPPQPQPPVPTPPTPPPAPPGQLPAITLAASPSNIRFGDSSILTWSSTNATSCVAGGTWWGGVRPTTGSANTGRLTAPKSIFTLTCTGPGGSSTASTAVTIVASNPEQQPTRSVTLSWVTPTINADGTPLTDLAGFYVRYGTSSGNYSSSIRINDPNIGNYLVQGLAAGQTYYFTVAAFDTTGNTGANATEANKFVQ